MNTSRLLGLFALLVASATYATDGDRPDDAKPAEAKTIDPKPADTRNVRIIKPFSALTDLTADQTEKMKQIHRRYLDQIKALENKQHDELMAVLRDDQKKELLDAEAKERIARKVASAKSAAEKKADARPADSTAKPPDSSSPPKPPPP